MKFEQNKINRDEVTYLGHFLQKFKCAFSSLFQKKYANYNLMAVCVIAIFVDSMQILQKLNVQI